MFPRTSSPVTYFGGQPCHTVLFSYARPYRSHTHPYSHRNVALFLPTCRLSIPKLFAQGSQTPHHILKRLAGPHVPVPMHVHDAPTRTYIGRWVYCTVLRCRWDASFANQWVLHYQSCTELACTGLACRLQQSRLQAFRVSWARAKETRVLLRLGPTCKAALRRYQRF